MKDKIVCITGATSGIGKATAIVLSKLGAELILPVRNISKGKEIREEIRSKSPESKINLIECDLASLKNVRIAAEKIRKGFSRLDVLINNAGGIFQKRQLSRDGYELTFAMNHLGHFFFTNELLPLIKTNPLARIINVSSEAHSMGKLDFDDLQSEKNYSSLKVYANAKLCNLYFTYHLAERIKDSGVTVNSLHPGVVSTNFGGDYTGFWKYLLSLGRVFMIKPEKGAETSIYLASSPDITGISGKYFKEKKITETSAISTDKEIAAKLWEHSEKLIADALK